jgi:hypothetical protein
VLIGREVIAAISLYKQPCDLRNPRPWPSRTKSPPGLSDRGLTHTGDITHLLKPADSDTAGQILKSAAAREIFLVPGEHDLKTLPLHQAESPLDGES